MITLINEKDLNKTTIGPDRINPLESLNDVTLGIGLGSHPIRSDR